MKINNKRRWKIIGGYCIGWTIAFIILSIVRGVGTRELGAVQFELGRSIIVAFVMGTVFGSISGYSQILTEERIYKRISIGKLILVRMFFFVLFLILLILSAYLMVTQLFGVEVGLAEFFTEPGSIAIYFYFFLVDTFMNALRNVNLMLGEKKLWQIFIGKFYQPSEDERIFMFLDLQSSTTLAEKLGHINYSMFIQDCFNDLGVVIENEAEIYQYVGDEVVLTWKLKTGIKNENCIKAYFNFKNKLLQKGEYYLNKYGEVPFFKAGVNSGIVTVTEVGKYKKEIAYHGDAINTAARIQGKCNELGQELLISKNLKDFLDDGSFTFKELGIVELKGKKKEVPIYAVYEGNGELGMMNGERGDRSQIGDWRLKK